jgi:hypothetical protein
MTARPERHLGIFPGSPMPADSDEVDALLRLVPDVAFAPELERCLFASGALAGMSPFAPPEQIAQLADAAYLVKIRAGLDAARERALREKNGGLEFLATTLGHFLDRMTPGEHPLVVALWCRSWARRRGRDDVPAAIAVAMDEYESSRGSGT